MLMGCRHIRFHRIDMPKCGQSFGIEALKYLKKILEHRASV